MEISILPDKEFKVTVIKKANQTGEKNGWKQWEHQQRDEKYKK